MPQLDKFIKAAQDHGADALILEVGTPASIIRGGKGHALGQQAVTDAAAGAKTGASAGEGRAKARIDELLR